MEVLPLGKHVPQLLFLFSKKVRHIFLSYAVLVTKSAWAYGGLVGKKKEKDVLLHTLSVGWPHITDLDFNSMQIKHSTTKTRYQRVGHMFSVFGLPMSSNSYKKYMQNFSHFLHKNNVSQQIEAIVGILWSDIKLCINLFEDNMQVKWHHIIQYLWEPSENTSKWWKLIWNGQGWCSQI